MKFGRWKLQVMINIQLGRKQMNPERYMIRFKERFLNLNRGQKYKRADRNPRIAVRRIKKIIIISIIIMNRHKRKGLINQLKTFIKHQ